MREAQGEAGSATWRQVLVCVAELVHPDRRAAVTSLAVSKDQRRLYVGDGRGRVHHWAAPQGSGSASQADLFNVVRDAREVQCRSCQVCIDRRLFAIRVAIGAN
jgi:hypothetical protein